MLLSVIPGLGQLYKGQVGRGLLWFMFVILFLVYATPIGILLWMICAGNAAFAGAVHEELIIKGARRRTRRRQYRPRQTMQPPSL
jgi:TM2 domain-containing membrane protein YozV